jgi:hypothetical protein
VLAIIGKIFFIFVLGVIGYIGYKIISDNTKNKRAKEKYIKSIKSDIRYLRMIENHPAFIVLPDDYFVDIQYCLYRIADLNANDIIQNDTLRNFMANYKDLGDFRYKTWHAYIVVL